MAVTYEGPFFDGDPNEVLKVAADAASEDIAETLLVTWYVGLDSKIRVNQNRYLSGLTKDDNGDGTWRVHDDISYVYGPWLEGVGSQNSRTRFRGYGQLANAWAQTAQKAEDIVEARIATACEELGGK